MASSCCVSMVFNVEQDVPLLDVPFQPVLSQLTGTDGECLSPLGFHPLTEAGSSCSPPLSHPTHLCPYASLC